MKLAQFINTNLRYEAHQISLDPELSQDIQTILINLGFMKKSEQPFASISSAALRRFQAEQGCYEPGFLGPVTAAKLQEIDSAGSRAASVIITIEAIRDTLLKKRPLDNHVLLDSEKYALSKGDVVELVYFESERFHFKFTLDKEIDGGIIWFVLCEDVKMSGGEAIPEKEKPADEKPEVVPTSQSTIKLDVPYKSQRDNSNNPDGSCNVTSMAMCLDFLSITGQNSGVQLEDELYEYAINNNLSRHSPHDLAQIVNAYGANDNFDSHAALDDVKGWLAAGNPVVTHGYFTSFGHIIVLVGYDDKGFIVNDPYGEWYAEGYDRNDPDGNNEKGKLLNYSYGLIENTCMTGGEFWVHFISK